MGKFVSIINKLILPLLLLCGISYGQTQNLLYAHTYTTTGADSGINLTNSGINFHQISFIPIGSPASCTVAVDKSVDGITWTAGGAITGQTCTTAAVFLNTTAVPTKFIRINITALTASTSVYVVYTGYVNKVQAASSAGGGNVVGPGSSTTNDAAVFGDTTGQLLADSGGPMPASATLATHNFVTSYTKSTGIFTLAQPACGDISNAGTACTAVAPANTAAVSHNFVTAYTAASGAFTQAQPASADLSDASNVPLLNAAQNFTAQQRETGNYFPVCGSSATNCSAGTWTSTANNTLENISGLSFTLAANTAQVVYFTCRISWIQNVGNTPVQWGMSASQNTNGIQAGANWNTTGGTQSTFELTTPITTTTATNISAAGTPTDTTAVRIAVLSGIIDNPSQAANTINMMVRTQTQADTVSVKNLSYCRIN